MNLTEFEKSLSDFSTGYETYTKLMSDIKRLDNLIQANEKQLNDSLIKIPFTHLWSRYLQTSNAYPNQAKQAINYQVQQKANKSQETF